MLVVVVAHVFFLYAENMPQKHRPKVTVDDDASDNTDESDIIAEIDDRSSTERAKKRLKKKEKKKARKKEKKETRYDRYEAMNANLPLTTLATDIEYITCDVCFKDTQDIIHGVFFRCLDCREDLCRSCYRKGRHSNLHRIYFMGHVPGEEGVDRNGKRREEEEAVPFSASPPRRSMLMDNDDD